MITIHVNKEAKTVAKQASLNDVLAELHIHTNGIAVAINNQVITRKEWSNTELQAEDHITIVQATQGG